MRKLLFMMFAAACAHAGAQDGLFPAVKQVRVQAYPEVADLACEKKPAPPRTVAAPKPDPMEVPDEGILFGSTPVAPMPVAQGSTPGAARAPSIRPNMPGQPFRMAIWGDSHLAAGFFTEELSKLLEAPADSVSNVLLPANMGRAGVRLPIRRACVSSEWKYEPGYLGRDNAVAPGPGLMNMFSDQPGATLAWDVRKDAQSPGYERVRVLYQQTESPLLVGLSIDGRAEQEVVLDARAGPAMLELLADRPIAQVKLRLIDGRLRLHGLELFSAQANLLEMDVFGYPGATVAGWKSADLNYLRSWFAQRPYQLVALEFGTNEGNVKPFDVATYRASLVEAVRNMRSVFPAAACILIAPGDRGVLVPRSANAGKKRAVQARAGRKAGKRTDKAAPRKDKNSAARSRKGAPRPAVDLLQYARIHADIAQVQREVAADAGCTAWSMQDAMGGPGASYRWAQQTPAWMARDLIHFTAAGYRQLARDFAKDMGWTAPPAQASQAAQ